VVGEVNRASFLRGFPRGPGYAVFSLVFVFRLFNLARLANSPFLVPSRGDMHFYDDWARQILKGDIHAWGAFYGLPGYPYLLAFLYRLFGYNPFVPGFLQAGIDAGIAAVIYALSVRVFTSDEADVPRLAKHTSGFRLNQGKWIGIAAALGWGCFVPAQAYAVVLMPTVWFVFAFWIIIWRIVRPNPLASNRECLLIGLVIGLVATSVATILILAPLVFAALVVRLKVNDRSSRTFALRLTIVVTGIAAGTSPCWIHNYIIARDPVFLSAHSGINFWIGNNADANGYPKFPPGLRAGQAVMLQDSITQAELAAGHPLTRAQISSYWSEKAKRYIAAHFSDWLRLLSLKLRNFWNAFQYDDLSIISPLREETVILPGLYFGVVAALAVPGIVLAWSKAPKSRWITIAVLLSTAALLPVFVTERYRLVAVPGLLIFAAFGLFFFWRTIAIPQLKTALVYLILLTGSTIAVAWPERDPALWALDPYNSGWQALESNNLPIAEKKLAIAHAYVPGNVETLFALGNLRLAQNNHDAAKSFYGEVIAIDPRHKGALNNLGVVALEENQFGEAEKWLRRAEDIDPQNAKTHFLLAKTLLARSHRDEAKVEIDIAIQLRPEQSEFTQLRKKMEADSTRP
jgi:Tetratricopeptide repeat